MCRPVTCKSCGKTTWAGCGQHIEEALSGVPQSQRCVCERGSNPSGASVKGVIGKLFGR